GAARGKPLQHGVRRGGGVTLELAEGTRNGQLPDAERSGRLSGEHATRRDGDIARDRGEHHRLHAVLRRRVGDRTLGDRTRGGGHLCLDPRTGHRPGASSKSDGSGSMTKGYSVVSRLQRHLVTLSLALAPGWTAAVSAGAQSAPLPYV